MKSHPYIRKHVSGSNPVAEHILIAERAIGRPLPKGAQIHHVNGIKKDNRPENLVICQDAAYHKLLHRRQEALDSCGNANWIKCRFCGKHDDPSNLTVTSRKTKRNRIMLAYHKACNTKSHRAYLGAS